MVRLSSMMSFRQHCCCWELVITCWFSSSIWNTKIPAVLQGSRTRRRTPRNVSVLFLTCLLSLPVYWTTVPRLYGLSPQWTRTDISFLVEFDLGQRQGQLLLQCWLCPQAGIVRNWFPMERERMWGCLANRRPFLTVFLFQSGRNNLV